MLTAPNLTLRVLNCCLEAAWGWTPAILIVGKYVAVAAAGYLEERAITARIVKIDVSTFEVDNRSHQSTKKVNAKHLKMHPP